MDIPPGWTETGRTLQRTFPTGDFARGVSLVVAIGRLADEADHHPDVLLTYPTVVVTLTTHDEGGVTERDLRLAAQIGRVWEVWFPASSGPG